MDTSKTTFWYVLYTKPRTEKKLAEQLNEDGIEAYCPLQVKVKQWSDRKKKVEMPLLPSMILINIKEDHRDMVFKNKHAVRYLYWLGKPAKVTFEEVESLRSLAEDNQFESNGLKKLNPGEKLDMSALGFENIQ